MVCFVHYSVVQGGHSLPEQYTGKESASCAVLRFSLTLYSLHTSSSSSFSSSFSRSSISLSIGGRDETKWRREMDSNVLILTLTHTSHTRHTPHTTHTHMHTHTRTNTHTHMRAHTRMHAHTRTRTHTHTHTLFSSSRSLLSFLLSFLLSLSLSHTHSLTP